MILAIVQARMGSSRLPGKVLKQICGVPMLQLQLERVKRSERIDRILVATTDRPADQPIFELCDELWLECFPGSENDVLDRFYQAARAAGARTDDEAGEGAGDTVVRLTADCPLIDHQVIDQVIELFVQKSVAYASNINPPTFPDGLDVEVMSFTSLERAWREAKLSSEREHVTPYIRNHPELFPAVNYEYSRDLSGLRWTVDEAADFEFVTIIYEHFYRLQKDFSMDDILAYLDENPELAGINKDLQRNEGYNKSLAED